MSLLVALNELMGQKFTIPHYQRGYRWEDQEVNELLDDLWAFQKDKESGDFYCLQPVVLQQNSKGSYAVLDGQQRLTTLYLILVYLEKNRKDDNYTDPLFSLNYETRRECETFLSEKKFTHSKIDSSNIDFYHICNAYQCIDNWFNDNKHSGAKSKLVPILLDKTDKGNRNVNIIRYEVDKKTNPIDVFIRLNVGKIPLTDAELTKALLLQSDKYSTDELEFNRMKLHNIASEWDIIETTLQEPAFWFFLNDNSNSRSTHIEFIFDLVANKINSDKKYFWDKANNKQMTLKKHATFLIFSEYLQDLIDNKKYTRIEAVEKVWSSVTEYYEFFKEWFLDRTLYHYIGLIITLKGNNVIDSLILQSKEKSKTKFTNYLKEQISTNIKTTKSIDKLVYEDDNGKPVDYKDIMKILLLHNVDTTLKSDKEKPRFPFELYKKENWSLEHIYARNSQSLTDIVKQKVWLEDHIKSLSNSNIKDSCKDLIEEMEKMLEQNEIDNDMFVLIQEKVYEATEKYSEFDNDENLQSIKNLCLLDKATNSQLSNSVFDVKREKIKKRELEGYYIPICSRNVFLKAYTAYPATNVYWTKVDRIEYFEDIKKTYIYYTN